MTEIEREELHENLVDQISDEEAEVDEENAEKASELAVELWDQLDHSSLDIEPEEVGYNFYRYLDYDVEPESARSTILRNLASTEGVDVGEIMDGEGSGEVQEVQVSEIDDPDQFVTVEVEVADIWDNDTDVLSQVGLVQDETGRVKFKTWEKSEKPLLTEGQTYRLERVATDEYQGNMEISINSETNVEMIDKEMEDPDSTETFRGALVDIQAGSGLIQRCSEDDCTRVLSDGSCAEHGDVEGEFDLRIKGVLDNGEETQDIVLNREFTEQVTGIRLEEAEQMAKDALDTAVVADEMEDEILLNYYEVEGWVSDYGDLITQELEEVEDSYDVTRLVERLSALETNTFDQEDTTEVN
jgi:replication factor A1